MGKQWKQWQTIFLGSKITADGDCSHEIKRHLLLRRKAMTNLDSLLKGRDITLPTKVDLVKAMVFPVIMYGCESWTIKKAECWRTDAFELCCWRRLLRIPWTERRSNHSIQKAVSPESFIGKTDIEPEAPILWPPDVKNWLIGKDLMLGKIEGRRGEGENRGWDGWMAWPTQWTWVWASSRSWWWTGKSDVLQSMRSQRVGCNWVTELNWAFLIPPVMNSQYMSSKPLFLWENWSRSKLLAHRLWPGDCKWGPKKQQSKVLPTEQSHCLGPFPKWTSRLPSHRTSHWTCTSCISCVGRQFPYH